ncbi:hypothetical protein GCM10027425_08200 [Alteromonas gracilis]
MDRSRVTSPRFTRPNLSVLTRRLRRADRRHVRTAAIVAPMVTLAAVAVGFTGTDEAADQQRVAAPAMRVDVSGALEGRSAEALDRSAPSRVAEVTLERVGRPADVRVSQTMWTTTELNLRVQPREKAKVVDVLAARAKVVVTGQREAGFAEVRSGRHFRWVSAEFLAEERPPAPEPAAPAAEKSPGGSSAQVSAGVSGAACATSDVESGLVPNAIAVHRAVCNNYPQITTYFGLESRGDHGTGNSLDVMTYGDTGTQSSIAEYLRANAGSLGVEYIIYSRQIWSVERASEGWRPMEDRGSTTANHYDHVHVTVY